MSERTYLELSQEGGGSHKFYEVIVDGTQVQIRYGRIGDKGQQQVKDYPTPAKAQSEAKKKINSKLRKGYEQAVMGVRKKRAVTRRSIPSGGGSSSRRRSGPAAKPAPVLWKFGTGRSAFGIFIDQEHCWVGNESGKVFCLSHEGEVLRQFRLPDGVKCIVADDEWLYAGCDDGKVYDLGGKVPRVAYEIDESVDIYWLDIYDGVLGVSDNAGNVTTINHEDESQWTRKSDGRSGWMVRCDEIGVYHGHSAGVTMYDWEDGSKIWDQKTSGSVLFGWQEDGAVYAGTGSNSVDVFSKKGEKDIVCKTDASVYSCATAEDGKYIFAGDGRSSIYCFDHEGKRLWKLATGCGSAFSMQYFDQKVYIVTTDGSLACLDASEEAIKAAQEGVLPETRDIKVGAAAAAAVEVSDAVETTGEVGDGVLVECIKVGSKLRVRVLSDGYNKDWNVQFPKNIRAEGARFVVDGVREAGRGGFYRAIGDIKRLT